MKKIFACLLALLMLTSTLFTAVGCSDKGDEESEEYSMEVSTSDDGKRYDENGYLMDDLPEDLNFGGKQVNILTCEEFAPSVCPTEINNTALNDTSFSRNKIIETRLGVTLNFVLEMGVATSAANLENFMSAVANSGSGDYDLICAFSPTPSSLAINGYLINLSGVKYLDFEKPWWSDSVLENAFYNTVYYASTNCSGTVLEQIMPIFYNRTTLAENNLPDPEKDVLEGTWTLEKLYNYSTNLYSDIDNTQSITEEDKFGLVFAHYVVTDAFFYGCGFNTTRNNASTGLPEFTMENTTEKSRMNDFVGGLVKKMNSADCYVDGVGTSTPDILIENRTAFYATYLKQVSYIPDAKDWGVIPMPKIDENQASYISTANNDFDMWCIPKVALDTDVSGAVMEAYASGCYRTVAPKYYEENLSYRYSNDENGLKIFSMIREGMKFDFGRISGMAIGTFDELILRPCYRGGTNAFLQNWATEGRAMKKKLNTLIDEFKDAGTAA